MNDLKLGAFRDRWDAKPLLYDGYETVTCQVCLGVPLFKPGRSQVMS